MTQANKTTDYQKQANDFLEKSAITFTPIFVKYDKHFSDDKDSRDIYDCIFKREGKSLLKIRFGQSIAHSGKIKLKDLQQTKKTVDSRKWDSIVDNPNKETPTSYDVLACITKDEPGTFEDFCNNYGYNIDSIKDQNTYYLVVEEWQKVSAFFTPEELEQLQEIQ